MNRSVRGPGHCLTFTFTMILGSVVCADDADPAQKQRQGLVQLKHESQQLADQVTSVTGREFLRAVERLPSINNRTIYRKDKPRSYISAAEWSALNDEARAGWEPVEVDESFYYTTRYGTPLAYVRALELYAGVHDQGLQGKKVLDFGYGTVGQLRLMALCGADAVGVDIDSMHTALYSNAQDQGVVANPGGRDGSITLVEGRFPDIAAQVGAGFDLITSKNTLKNGFFNPEQPLPKERLMDLGVDQETFVQTVFKLLKPGGVFLIYNICPAPSKPGEFYKNWADGRCPFSRAMLESAGFTVRAFNADDNAKTRSMAMALGWHEGEHKMDLENDLFGSYTIALKP